MDGGLPVYVDVPTIVALRGEVALFGSPVNVWATPTVFLDSTFASLNALQRSAAVVGAVVKANGRVDRLIPFAPGARAMHSPKAVADGSNGADVFWTTAPDSFAAPAFGGNALWHARYGGTAWGEPERIFAADRINWDVTEGAVIRTDEGPEIAAPAYTHLADKQTRHAGIVVIHRVQNTWSASWVELGFPAYYLALTATGPQTSVLAFSGGVEDSVTHHLRNGLYVARSSDGGTAWTVPIAVAGPEWADRGWLITITARTPDSLDLLWMDKPRPSLTHSVIHHLSSTDGGATWQAAEDLTLPWVADSFHAASRRDGSTVIVVRAADTSKLSVATLNGAGWSPVTTPFAHSAVTVPAIGPAHNDSIYLVWGTPHFGAAAQDSHFPAASLDMAVVPPTQCANAGNAHRRR